MAPPAPSITLGIHHCSGLPTSLWAPNTTLGTQHCFGYPSSLWAPNNALCIHHHFGYSSLLWAPIIALGIHHCFGSQHCFGHPPFFGHLTLLWAPNAALGTQHHFGYPSSLWVFIIALGTQHWFGHPSSLWAPNTSLGTQHHFGHPTLLCASITTLGTHHCFGHPAHARLLGQIQQPCLSRSPHGMLLVLPQSLRTSGAEPPCSDLPEPSRDAGICVGCGTSQHFSGLGKEWGVRPRCGWGNDPPCARGCGMCRSPPSALQASVHCTAPILRGPPGSSRLQAAARPTPHLEAIQAGEYTLSFDHVLFGAGQLEAFPSVHLLLGGLGGDLVAHPIGLHPGQLVCDHLPCARQGKLRHGGPTSAFCTGTGTARRGWGHPEHLPP